MFRIGRSWGSGSSGQAGEAAIQVHLGAGAGRAGRGADTEVRPVRGYVRERVVAGEPILEAYDRE